MNNKIIITTIFMAIILTLTATGCGNTSEPLEIPDLPQEIPNIVLPDVLDLENSNDLGNSNSGSNSTGYDNPVSRVPILPRSQRPVVL
ncbi:MAG: hypothetical protein RSB96_04480, partial [Oscillospiraceae bacterium]